MDGGSLRVCPTLQFCPRSLNHEQQLPMTPVSWKFLAGDQGPRLRGGHEHFGPRSSFTGSSM